MSLAAELAARDVAGPMPTAAMPEFNRFLVLFDRLVSETCVWFERTPPEKLDWLPIDNPNVRFGDRVSRVTIQSLFIHMAVADHKLIKGMAECDSGALLPLPGDPELSARLKEGDLVSNTAALHEEDMRRLRSYDETILNKTVRFAGDQTTWSVMGFLWGLYAHRAYHLGNLDIYVRQANVDAPDFYSFNPKIMA